jgi:hypothetical protein
VHTILPPKPQQKAEALPREQAVSLSSPWGRAQ